MSACRCEHLSGMQVKRQVLPALLKLTNDAELGVKALAIEALAKLWQLFSNSSSSLEKLHRHLDTIMSCGVHEVTAQPPIRPDNCWNSWHPLSFQSLHVEACYDK